MALNRKVFFTRLGSAIVFCIIMMAGLLGNAWTLAGLALLIQVLCLNEYFRLMRKIRPDALQPAWLPLCVQLAGAAFLLLLAFVFRSGGQIPQAWLAPFVCVPMLLWLAALLQKAPLLPAVLQAFGACVYIIMPVALLVSLREISPVLPLALILMIWMNDTMAYLVGSFIGKTPFSEISPKKTWEGTAGGALLTMAGAAVWGIYSDTYGFIHWMAISVCVAVAGTAGDLLESRLKRMAGVKDSGSIMPGHGGALDRFDSLLAAIPFVYAYVVIFVK